MGDLCRLGMRCLRCGDDNRDDARFCASCGVRIGARCPTCDRELSAGAKFCDGCGAPVEAVSDAGEQSRKTLTIVFADLQGSTGLQERMDPESVRALMGRYYAAMRDVVGAHGGKVVKFVGDGTMAVFGVPEVAEDDALRAVRAAAAMQAAFEPLAREHGLALRVGVNTGEVVVDADDADVVGDAVNVASRLESAAGPGEVVVGAETWRLTRHAAEFDAPTALTLKGRTGQVHAHRFLALTDDVDAAPAPFVGRVAELERLGVLFAETVGSGTPRLATVIGSPGVGKSRLAQQLRASVDDRATTVRGRCDQHAGATFAPVAELLDGLGSLPELLANDPERDRILAATDALAGTGPQPAPEETFWAVRRVLETAARTAPVIAVLDDLHWAEPLLLDLVEHLAEWLNEPVLLVAVARPELRELRPSLTEPYGRPGALIMLEGLERDATERLACELLGTDRAPADLLERLTQSSDGNPLFVRELVRMLIDDGVLRRGEQNEWVLAVDAAEMEVPPTIQSLLAARLDRLRPQERTVLERAAVIGAEVYRGALEELVPPEVRGDLDALLESLRRKELLEPAGTYWIDERVLRFHHALIREAAYRRLLKESRAGLHERVAAWLVAKTGGGADHDEIVGFHLEQAQANLRSLGPLDGHGRELANDAADRLGAAARRALDGDDLLAAGGLAGRAVDCLDPDDRARADLLLTRCEALLGAGDVASAGPAIDDLLRLGAGSRRIEAWATCFAVQHTALVDPRSLVDAEQRLVDAAAVLDGAGDAAGAAKAHRVYASLLARLGRIADCEAALDRALGAARAAGDRRQMTSVLGAAPLAALWGPSPVPRAGGRCLDVIRLVRITTGAPAVEATSIRCQAVLEAFRGRADAARSLIESARAIAEELGLRHGLLEVELFAGIVELCAGDAAAAAEHLRRAQDGFTAMGIRVDAAQAAAMRGRAALALGEVDDALDFVATSEELGGQDLKTSIAWRAVQAEVLAARGNIAEATELAQAAVALAAPTDALIDHADALAALAAVHAAAGDTAAAQRVAAQAGTLYEQKGATALAAGLHGRPDTVAAAVVPPAVPGATSLGNAATRAGEAFARLVVSGRVNDAAALCSPSLIMEDRRPGMQTTLEDLSECLDLFRVIGELGIDVVDDEILAVRGDTLALGTSFWRGRFDAEVVILVRTDGAGLIDRISTYEPADLNDAIHELNELYLAELSEDQARCWRATIAVPRAQNDRDWAALRACVVDDIRVVDHRPAAQGTFAGIDRFIDGFHSMVEVAPENTIVGRSVLAVDARCALIEMGWLAGAPSSTSFEDARLIISVVSDDDRVASLEFFTPEQGDEAWARYRELTTPAPALGNAASRLFDEFCRLGFADRFDELAAIYSPQMTTEDRRPGMSNRTVGAAANVENIRTIRALGLTSLESRVVAVRGERLALVAWWARGEYDLDLLTTVCLDAEGRWETSLLYDPTQLTDAVQELDELYLAQLSEGTARCMALNLGFLSARNRRDWDAMRSALADDLRVVDHRLASLGEYVGADSFAEYARAMVDVAPDYRIVVRSVLAAGDRCALCETASIGQAASGVSYEQPRLILSALSANGRIGRFELFAPEQGEEAWTRYRELTAPAPREPVGNPASAAFERMLGLILDGRADDTAALLAPDLHYEDVRPAMETSLDGRAANVEHFRLLSELDMGTIDADVVAVRGERLALVQTLWHAREFEIQIVTIVRVDDDGLMDLHLDFDPGDLRSALEELDRRYFEDEGSGASALERSMLGGNLLINQRRWDDLRALTPDDLVFVDRRPAGFGAGGPDHFLQFLRSLEVVDPGFAQVLNVGASTDRCALFHSTTLLTGNVANSYAWSGFIVAAVGADAVTRIEIFDLDQSEDAWARYRALAATAAPLANGASRLALHSGPLLLEGRFDEVQALFSPAATFEDRRFLGRGVVGLADGMENFRVVMDHVDAIDTEVLAVRGDHLDVHRSVWSSAEFEVTLLTLMHTDADGRIDMCANYDPGDLPTALEELDRLYVEELGDRLTSSLRLAMAGVHTHNRRDWDGLRGCFEPDVAFVDHRAAAYGDAVGVDFIMEYGRRMIDVDPHFVQVLNFLDWNDSCVISRSTPVIHGAVGGSYDRSGVMVTHVRTSTGRIDRYELFGPEQIDAAWARYRELSAEQVLENEASSTLSRMFQCVLDGRPEDASGLFANDMVHEDRRPGMAVKRHGRDASVENIRVMSALDVQAIESEVIAIRGDRLAVVSTRFGGGGYELRVLTLARTDGEGRLEHTVVFDPRDLPSALVELDEQYAAGEASECAEMMRLQARLVKAHAERDWEAWRVIHAENIVVDDHRPAGWGHLEGVEAMIERNKVMLDLAPDYAMWMPRVLALSERHGLAELNSTRTTAGGEEYDVPRLVLASLRSPSGPIERVEFFALDQLDQAWQRFRELTSEDSDDNLATVANRRWFDGLMAGDWDAVREMLTPDFVLDDRRAVVANRVEGREAALEWLASIASFDLTDIRVEPVAMRGERLVLLRVVMAAGDFEVPSLILLETDADGRGRCAIGFDPDDLNAALAELEEHFLAGEGGVYAHWLRPSLTGARDTHSRRDWSAFRALHTDDVVLVDRRRAGGGEYVGADRVLEYHQAMVDIAPMHTQVIRRQPAIGDHIVLSEMVSGSADAAGDVGAYEVVSLLITVVDEHGRISRMERFEGEDADTAWARYRELGGEA